ncbi:RraA family protein [Parapusillimonas granuli]|uniref:Putative 4-hydroxy-4-methyl-2-oxoglutarate aldolase n=1 Tax=Parapusillimonas granuli TaxID=380911 RepID=A0A853FYX9_9BURK|nr:RraA family protein [Parapusillimonas granuli]MBB5216150.1 regulator of RNase E activity RraA [Parapusillimonas granuli]MEB2400426.1 RraA family protein [Alcaligenaceae bacterium]NYT47831.1 RraA family protein [Parapusillimonas granuli]
MSKKIDPALLTPELIEVLTSVDTPTICNALEVATGTRTNKGFTRGAFHAAHPGMKPVMGFARTATLRTAHPYTEPLDAIKARRIAWYEHLEGKGVPTFCVMEDIDDEPGLGAFWGEVHSNVLKGLGVAGVLTNGAMRDFGMLAEGFQILAATISPSHGYAQIVTIGQPVQIHGLTIEDGDLIHADRHGAVVIPPEGLATLPHGIEVITAKERPLIEAAKRPGFSVEDLKRAMKEADDIH